MSSGKPFTPVSLAQRREGPHCGLGRAASPLEKLSPLESSSQSLASFGVTGSFPAKPNRSTVSRAITEGFRLGRGARALSGPALSELGHLHHCACQRTRRGCAANKASQNIPLERCAPARQSEGLSLSFTGKVWPASTGTGREGCSGQTQYTDCNSMPIVLASAMERSPAPSWPLAMPRSKADAEPRVCSIHVQNKPCHVPRETTSILQQGTLQPCPFRKQDFNFDTFSDPLDTFFQRRSPPAVPPDPSPPTGEDQHLSLPHSSIRPWPRHLHVLTLLVVIKWSSR